MTSSSPLTEVNPRSLDELFASEPDTLTDGDIQQMVIHLRAERHQFKQTKAAKENRKTPPAIGNGAELLSLLELTK